MMKLLTVLSIVSLAGSTVWAAPAREEGAPPPPLPRDNKLRVLVFTGGHGFDHDSFFSVFQGQPDITVKEVTQPGAAQWFAPDKADEYDVMVWYDLWQKISDEEKTNLVALLNKGKPLVVLHHSVEDYEYWPEGVKIIGGRYHEKEWSGGPGSEFHPDQKFKVEPADPKHPITRFMQDFELEDETYNKVEVLPTVKPLLKVDHPKSNKVIGWTHTYGKSPVVYLQPGHGPGVHKDANYRRLVIQSIRWAAGRLPDTSDEGFVQLLNGKNFDGWKFMGDPKGYWFTPEGILRSESGKGGEWMRTEKEYGDYILRVEWRVGEGGNSGVFIRCNDKEHGYPWETGFEVQISNEPRDIAHCTGALYGVASVDPRPDESADVWHEFQIECRGPFIKIFADNIPVIDVDERTIPAMKGRQSRGYIGLQDSHNPSSFIEYRKVAVKEISMDKGEREKAAGTWRLGVQAYTFRLFSFYEAVDKAKALGLKFIEAYPGQKLSPDQPDAKFGHESMSAEQQASTKKKLNDAGVKLVNYGVVRIANDEAAARKLFDFCKAMGIETITAEPDTDAFDLLDKLTAEYKINIAIHNHPKPSHYWSPQTVLDAVKGHNERIGACADTGHWPRSGLNPTESLKKLSGRIISLHFKDLDKQNGSGHDMPWGTGSSDAKAMLTELHRQGFSGVFSIEYEYNWENSMPEIAECIKYFKQVAKELGQAVE